MRCVQHFLPFVLWACMACASSAFLLTHAPKHTQLILTATLDPASLNTAWDCGDRGCVLREETQAAPHPQTSAHEAVNADSRILTGVNTGVKVSPEFQAQVTGAPAAGQRDAKSQGVLTDYQVRLLSAFVHTGSRLLSIRQQVVSRVCGEITVAQWANAANLTVAELASSMTAYKKAKRTFITAYKKLAEYYLRKWYESNSAKLKSSKIPFEDLRIECLFALNDAMNTYDPDRPNSDFPNLLKLILETRMTHVLSREFMKTPFYSVPTWTGSYCRKLWAVRKHLHSQLGREAELHEIAAQMNVTPDAVTKWTELCRKRSVRSLDRKFMSSTGQDEDSNSYQDIVISSSQLNRVQRGKSDFVNDLERSINELKPELRRVVLARMNLETMEVRPFEKVAEDLGITMNIAVARWRRAMDELRTKNLADSLAEHVLNIEEQRR